MVGGLRRAVVGIALTLGVWAAVPHVAQAATSTTTTTVPPVAISFAGTAADGTALTLGVHVTDVTLGRFSPAHPTTSPGGPGSAFLDFDMTTDESAGTGPSFNGFDTIPIGDISIALADGTDVQAVPPGPQLGFLEGNYSFVVPADTTGGTLEVTAVTVSAFEYPGEVGNGGGFTSIAFQSAAAPIVVPPPPVAVTTPTTAPRIPTTERTPSRTLASPTGHTGSPGFTTSQQVGAGAGGGLLVVVLVIPLWRRRAYRKADREGHVIIDSPPVVPPQPEPVATASVVNSQHHDAGDEGVVRVKILGPVEIDGLVHRIDSSPVRELLVFLALHPGRRFTSSELRSSIWVEGRDEPKAETFRNYLARLRQALPPGSVEKQGTHHSIATAITTDWGDFCDLVAMDDDRAHHLAEALSLVRGAAFDGSFSGRNSPYAWAGDLNHRIEVQIEKAGHELASLGLEAGDLALADAGTTQVLRALPTSLLTREDHLRLGSAIGGPGEVDRRMRVLRRSLNGDAEMLEPLARSLGWAG